MKDRIQLYITLKPGRDDALIKILEEAEDAFPSAATKSALLRRIIEDWNELRHIQRNRNSSIGST